MATGYDLCRMKVKYLWLLPAAALFPTACQRDPYREGARLYEAHCANCHGEQGQGLGGLIPPLTASDYLQQNKAKLACILVHGLNDTIMVNGKSYSGQPMPANAELTDVHLSNLLNYIGNNWGNKNGEVSIGQVRDMLKDCSKQQHHR
jgi:mono/diheme cytochrome c family protein